MTNEKNPQVLIYDESREHLYQGDLTDDVKEMLGDKSKAYYNAEIRGTEFTIFNEVEQQDW